MKIWCFDHASLSYHIHSDLYFSKEEAQERYDAYNFNGAYRKLYQVEDIWGWCGRHFNEVIIEILASRDVGDGSIHIFGLRDEIVEAAEIEMKYHGYIARERALAEKVQRLENIKIKDRFDYHSITQLSTEARQKLTNINPETLAQASRIPGVSPNDISVLLVLRGR